jgi:hypothetical protein
MYRTFGYDGQKFACHFYFQRWGYLSLGFHVSLIDPNVEIHVPFGFFRIGRVDQHPAFAQGWVWGKQRETFFHWEDGEGT